MRSLSEVQWNGEPVGELKEEVQFSKTNRQYASTVCLKSDEESPSMALGLPVHRMNEGSFVSLSYLWLFLVMLSLVGAGIGMAVEWLNSMRNESLDLSEVWYLMCLLLAMHLWLLQLTSPRDCWEMEYSIWIREGNSGPFCVILAQCLEKAKTILIPLGQVQ